MPVGFNSPARNLFLLGSSGAQVVSNFFESISKASTTDGVFVPDEIRYIDTNKKYALAGSAQDSNSKGFGWLERQDYNLETGSLTTDYSKRIESTQAGVNLTLRAMELDATDNLIVVGKTADTPWIAKYSNAGVLDWQSTTNSADVEYTGITSSNGNYYACGSTPTSGSAQAFVERFDSNGNPGWGKSAFMLGRDVVLEKISANSGGHVVAVGYLEDDSADKGYIVKLDTTTGEVLWDRTLERNISGFGLGNPSTGSTDSITPAHVKCTACYIDSQDQIYVVGTIDGNSPNDNGVGEFLIKYTAEGNMVWQRENNTTDYILFDGAPNMVPFDVKSDGETEQTVVLSVDDAGPFALYNSDIFISKYSKNGDLVFRRRISKGGDNLGAACLDADPSFYYIMFRDQRVDGLAGEPDRYTFGKVSTSGNGFGAFQYDDGEDIVDYTIVSNAENKIGRLSDGSVRNDTSDLMTYPFTANKLVFDDLATHVSNKKRQMDNANSFEYSGSPAIRPADFKSREYTTDEYGVPPQKNYIGLSESLSPASTSSSPTPNNTWTRQSTNVNITANDIANPLGVGNRGEKYNISATNGRRLEYGVPSGVFVAGQTYTYSWWMKAITTNAQWAFQLLYAGSSNSTLRFADRDGNILENVSTNGTYKPTDTEWHRVVWTFTANNTGSGAIGGYNENNETGDLWYLWGAQLVDGPDPLRYYTNRENNTPENAAGTEHAPDIVSGAYNFDQSEILQIGKIPGDFSEMTVEIWFKSDTLSNWQNPIDCNYHVNDANGTTQSGNIGPRLEINASGECRWYWGSPLDDNNRNFASANTTITTGRWYHAVLSIGGPVNTDGSAYINGELLGTGAQNGAAGNTWYGEIRDLILGRGFVLSSRYFDGQVGEVRIYPRALTAAQVFQNYNATKSKYINEAPDTAPKIGPGIVYGNMLLNYDFGNRATYDRAENLLRSSEDYTNNNFWIGGGSQGITVLSLSDIVSPFGTKNVYLHNDDATGGDGKALDENISITPSATQQYTISVYAKQGSSPKFDFYGFFGGSATKGTRLSFVWSTKEIFTNGSDGGGADAVASGYEEVGNGWVRVWMTVVDSNDGTNGTLQYRLYPGSRDNNAAGTTYFWGSQMERGSLGRYIKTYGSAITTPTTVKNLSSSSNGGTLNGVTFNNDGYMEFDAGDSLSFSDVTVSDGSSSTVSWTFECWIKPDTFGGTSDIGILLSGGSYEIQLEQGGSDAGKIRYKDSVNTSNFSNLALTAGQWNHLVVAFSPFPLATSVSIQSWMNNNFTLNTGHTEPLQTVANNIGDNFKGQMAESRIYDKTLSDTEREQNFNATRGKYGV